MITNNKYRFEQVVVRMRWIDYARIRTTFPKLKDESAAAYFKRLAEWMRDAE